LCGEKVDFYISLPTALSLTIPVAPVVFVVSTAFFDIKVLEGEKGRGIKSHASFVLPLLLSTCLEGTAVYPKEVVD